MDQAGSSASGTPAGGQGRAGRLACSRGRARIKDRAGSARRLGGTGKVFLKGRASIRARSVYGAGRARSLIFMQNKKNNYIQKFSPPALNALCFLLKHRGVKSRVTRGGTKSFLSSHEQVSSQIPSPQRVKVNEIIK